MRIGRTDGTTTYEYIYAGSEIIYTIIDGVPLRLSHTADGTPLSVVYKGGTYYYVTNLQGDVVAILDEAGNQVVGYTYDAWGNILSTTGRMADTLGQANPLRYRGYVYDNETGLYYLQSRYYDPEVGRFINADGLISTGQGLLGNNMFAYCGNNPVINHDPSGTCFHHWQFWKDCDKCARKTNGEKIYTAVVSFLTAFVKTYKVFKAATESIDAYAGAGLGLRAGTTVCDFVELSGGISYSVVGARFNDGALQTSQNYYSGAEVAVVEPLLELSEEKYRELTFSGPFPAWISSDDQSVTIFSFDTYVGIGISLKIAFDVEYFYKNLVEIFDE